MEPRLNPLGGRAPAGQLPVELLGEHRGVLVGDRADPRNRRSLGGRGLAGAALARELQLLGVGLEHVDLYSGAVAEKI